MKKQFVESREDQKIDHGFISDDIDEENEIAINQKSHVNGKGDQKYADKIGDGDHGSAHSGYSEKNSEEEGQELKEENASGLRSSERNNDKPKPD